MAQQQPQGGGGSPDNSMAIVWILILLAIAGYIIWETQHQYIVSFVFQINLWQAKLVNLFLRSQQLASLIYLMETVDRNAVDWPGLMSTVSAVGDFLRYPVGIILVVLALILYRSDIKLKYRKAHNMNSLRTQEQFNWPAIMPVIKEDLVNQDVNKGAWAMAMTPMEFARKYQLLKKDDALLSSNEPGKEMTAGIKRGDAKRVFTLQLGPYWDGFEHCPPHVAAIAAVFIARINRDRDAANKILSELDRSFVAGKPNFSIAKPVIEKYKNTELVQEIIQKHAYTLNIMASFLEGARDDGVVPSSEFLWLKPVDRRLWYVLNCVGRQTPYSEVAGCFAHWRAEKELGRRSLVPMIDEAIKALEIAVKEVKLKPREMQELEP